MNWEAIFALIVADTDQDREHARAWIKQATNADKIRVWQAIQKMDGHPIAVIISRLAQLKFVELVLEMEGQK